MRVIAIYDAYSGRCLVRNQSGKRYIALHFADGRSCGMLATATTPGLPRTHAEQLFATDRIGSV